jgi:uncharacterized protein YigA (DUF484 family)
MTTPSRTGEPRATTAPTLSATDVRAYLTRHPEFFADHPDLLANLRLPHANGGQTTVSLVERQMEVLREQRREVEARLQELIAIGHGNDALADKMHRLACRLVRARGVRARLDAMESSLREDFAAPDFVLVLTRASGALEDIDARHLRIVSAETPDFRSFESLILSGKPRCGQVRDTQRDFLFPASGSAIGSVALVPLSILHAAAVLAIGSPNAHHFNPTMGTEYLARIGDLIATALDGADDL